MILNPRWTPSRPSPPAEALRRDCRESEPSCTDPACRALLLRYAWTGCDEHDAETFEAHLLECDACFEDLKTLDRARQLLEEQTGYAPRGLRGTLRRLAGRLRAVATSPRDD